MSSYVLCNHHRRRDFLKIGALSALGLDLASYLRFAQGAEVSEARAQSAIFINLAGGPSHIDSFDLKPSAESEYRGEFSPIRTNVSGVEICELLPNLAKCADKYALLRSVSHSVADHGLGSQYINTGTRPIPTLQYPGYGSVVAKELPSERDIPPFVAIPSTPQRAGFLGIRYAALQTGAAPRLGRPFSMRGISLDRGLTVYDIEKRQGLLRQLDTTFQGLEETNDLIAGLDQFSQQAFDVISSPRARAAFDVSQEPIELAEQFGDHSFGQSCLLAVRLIEAGVRFVTIDFGNWDTHGNNFTSLKTKLPELDTGLAAMLRTLSDRGLLDSTIVCATGEFGRTPKINPGAGRDHWPRAMSVLMAGGGVRGGQVIGATDERATEPATDPIAPDQIAASLYQALGIDYTKEYQTSSGRPIAIVRDGSVIPELF